MKPWHKPPMPTMRVIEISRFGGPEVLRIGERPIPTPQAGEVLIKVAAAGVNRPDILQRQGNYPVPPGASDLPGLEVAGDIVAFAADDENLPSPHPRSRGERDLPSPSPTGRRLRDEGNPQITSDKSAPHAINPSPTNYAQNLLTPLAPHLNIGDPVCALVPGGGYAEYCIAPHAHCLPLPPGWTLTEAASLPETLFTVWSNLCDQAHLRAGERVLIHGGASGIGVTAIQLAKALGATVYVTAGSAEKCHACLALGADAAINYREEDFVAAITQLTHGAGVDVILDMIGGDYLPRNLACLNVDGRLALIALQHGGHAAINLGQVLIKRLTLRGSTLRPRSHAFKAAIAQHLHTHVWPWLAEKKIKPVIDRVFPLAHAAEAHRYLDSGQHVGKLVLAVGG